MLSHVSFYSNWSFWAVVISIIALILSQLRPISMMLRKNKVIIEPFSILTLTHTAGNPNIRWSLGFRNEGGTPVRIKRVTCDLIYNGQPLIEMVGNTYYRQDDDKTMIFSGFSLRPDDEAFYDLLFFKAFDRFENRNFRASVASLKEDIAHKREANIVNEHGLAEAEQNLVEPFIEMFNQKFSLNPGEYHLRLNAICEPNGAASSQEYRFTLYESDSEELRKYVEDYKYGTGLFFAIPEKGGVFLDVEKV